MRCHENIRKVFISPYNKATSNFFSRVCLVIILFASFFLNDKIKAQPTTLSKSRSNGYYTYIFRLSNDQMLKYHKMQATNYVDNMLFNNFARQLQLVDSFYTDTADMPKLPYGNYLLMKANRDQIETELIKNHSFNLAIVPGNINFTCFVYDSIGNPRSDMTVKFDEEVLKYDVLTGYYQTKSQKKKMEL